MLHHISLIVSLVAVAVCQGFKNENLEMLRTMGRNPLWQPDTIGAMKPVGTVGKAGGCCLPDEMESLMGMMIGSVEKGKANILVGSLTMLNDAKQEKAYMHGSMQWNGHGFPIQIWQDYAKLTQYSVYPNGRGGKECKKSKLKAHPWYSQCIPEGTKNLGDVYYGNRQGPNKLEATWYMYDDKIGNIAYSSFTNTSKPNECIPVTQSVYGDNGEHKGVPYTLTMYFMDIVPKISSKEAFKLPAICKKSDIPEVPAHHAFLGSIAFR